MFYIFRTTKEKRERIKNELNKARQGNRDNTDKIILRALQLLNQARSK